jgi:hypothetical protein
MAEEENTRSPLDIVDPSTRRPSDPEVDESREDEGDETENEDKVEPEAEKETPADKKAKPSEAEDDLSDYLDEVAGRKIAELTKKIAALEARVSGGNTRPPERTVQPVRPEPSKSTDEKVARRQSQFVARTSSRDGNALSPEERATRNVEELMRKRGLI